jgi:hypothetical protein
MFQAKTNQKKTTTLKWEKGHKTFICIKASKNIKKSRRANLEVPYVKISRSKVRDFSNE